MTDLIGTVPPQPASDQTIIDDQSKIIAELREQLAALKARDTDDTLRDRLARGPAEDAAKRQAEQEALELERQRIKLLEPDVELCHRFAKSLWETLQIRVPVKSNAARSVLQLAIADVNGAIERLRKFEAK